MAVSLEYSASRINTRYPSFSRYTKREGRNFHLENDSFQKRPLVEGMTIDGAGTLDLDDAIAPIRREGKTRILSVHIADVAAYVPPGSAITKDALFRGETIYYEDGSRSPMIPAKLSEGLLSLQEGELRPTITYSIPFDENLTPGELRIQQTKIVSRKKCTYEEIGDALRNGEHPLHKEVRDFANLAYDLKHVRLEKGAEDYRIEKALTPREEATTNAMSMVAEFMVVTNTKVTEFFSNNDIPTLFRNFRKDASPAEKRDLREKLEDLFADVDPADEKLIKHILKIAYGRAEYSTINRGHEALAVDFYGHHTSPLRRISDLLAQQQRNAAIRGETLPYSKSNLEIFGDNINAKKFERDLYAIEWRDEDKKAQQLNPLSKTKLIRSKDIFLHAVKKEP